VVNGIDVPVHFLLSEGERRVVKRRKEGWDCSDYNLKKIISPASCSCCVESPAWRKTRDAFMCMVWDALPPSWVSFYTSVCVSVSSYCISQRIRTPKYICMHVWMCVYLCLWLYCCLTLSFMLERSVVSPFCACFRPVNNRRVC